MGSEDIFVAALFVGVGVILGLMGSGGSIITLPVLTYLAGFGAEAAVTTTLIVVGVASLTGALLFYRQGYGHWRATAFMGIAGMPGAYLGAGLTGSVSPRALMLIFAAVMVGAAVSMLLPPGLGAGERSLFRLGLLGITIGLLAGFLGVGGGFLIVPALVVVAGIDTRNAIAASLGVITLNSTAGALGHLGQLTLPWGPVTAYVVATVAGIWLGTLWAGRLPEPLLRKMFGWALIVIALGIAVINVL